MKYSPSFVITLASAVAWAFLLVGRGKFWYARVDEHLGTLPDMSALAIEAIVPARDEAATIGTAIASLAAQRFTGRLRVTLVDDGSDDGTAELALAAAAAVSGGAPFEALAARALAPGWTGKLNALESGIAHVRAARGAPDYWLFTDADIAHDPGNVAALVAKAERDRLDLVSLMVLLRCESGWEGLLVPAFVFFFAKLYPFAWSNDRRRTTAAAAGGCIVISNAALERIGGLASIAGRLIDDCALAREVKRTGGGSYLGLTARTASIRRYDGLAPLWKMVARTAFTQLGRSYLAVAGAVAGMAFLYLVPPLGTVAGIARRDRGCALAGAFAWCAMACAYGPTARLYRRAPAAAFSLPAAALLYTAMTLDSALAHALRRGGAWKGRTY
ncbi:MAG: glycosyltransferase [Vulcanimicrobiaceae bacterium]